MPLDFSLKMHEEMFCTYPTFWSAVFGKSGDEPRKGQANFANL